MISTEITLGELHDSLAAIPPLDLIGMRLLQTHPAAGLFPTNIPRQQLREAVLEVTEYTTSCATLAKQLGDLTPIVLTTYPCLEFGL